MCHFPIKTSQFKIWHYPDAVKKNVSFKAFWTISPGRPINVAAALGAGLSVLKVWYHGNTLD